MSNVNAGADGSGPAMGTLTVLVGLCGSGKSELINKMILEKECIYDGGFLECAPKHQEVICYLRNGKDCVISEAGFCEKSKREVIVRKVLEALPQAHIFFVCFENDLEQANINCASEKRIDRAPQQHIEMNNYLSPIYKRDGYPENRIILKVYRPC